MADESLAEQNRRKLDENLARVQKQGVPPKAKAGSADRAREGPQPPPRPPPQPPGWEAWKKAHGARVHSVRYVDPKKAAEAADCKLLEITPGAGKEEVRKAFNRLAKQFHPDVGGDAEIFQAMQAAYKRLMKTAK